MWITSIPIDISASINRHQSFGLVDISADRKIAPKKQISRKLIRQGLLYRNFTDINLNLRCVMLVGEYTHTIDPKKRLAIPSKLRKELGDKMVLTKGLDGCLFLFSLKEFRIFAEKIGQLSFVQKDIREFKRLFLSGAAEVGTDQLGRILIPDYLKEYAKLGKQIIVAGLFNRLEIWDFDKWELHKKELESQADKIAEKLGELGVI